MKKLVIFIHKSLKIRIVKHVHVLGEVLQKTVLITTDHFWKKIIFYENDKCVMEFLWKKYAG